MEADRQLGDSSRLLGAAVGPAWHRRGDLAVVALVQQPAAAAA
jgi:hypothetical protein